ncbi:Sec-dependent nitrous-oxide reductase [Anaerolineales bacterium HSG6]|nr:Sec-dependent nitrous-oxide reductase [Anaerolineales bacterium HSG6]
MKRNMFFLVILSFLLVAGCSLATQEQAAPTKAPVQSDGGGGLSSDASAIAAERGLSPDDINAALKTYMPTGIHDDYMIFSSGGHSGQVLVIGVPSMRILKVIGVFTPEPWQGWGYGVGHEILDGGKVNGNDIHWADTHHPALSETAGEYDGEWLFINDKSMARIAVIDLRDFETKQIVKNPIAMNDHGGAFVTPNTEYIIEGGQYSAPLGGEYAPIEEYNDQYRGSVTLWKFNRDTGRIEMENSFAIELPPYWQDLCDAGKLASEGWIFCNSFNTERATGGIEKGNPPFEAGASQADTDYMHIIDLVKAEELFKAGKADVINDFSVISMQTAIDEGLLYLAPEPKSPHGVDVTPDGEFMVVSGKLDPHVTIYSIEKIKATIDAGKWETDDYGIPVLALDDVKEAQVELGLGPLHTQFDDQGYAYTSLFLDSMVARWALGGNFADKNPDEPWTLVGKTSVHYNIGHLMAAEGDTTSPDGKYLVAMNKWALDRFANVGPLLPQNFQLLDIDNEGDSMKLIYDMPLPLGEPHYAQMIKADKLSPWEIYPEVGWDSGKQEVSPNAVAPGEEKVVRDGKNVEVFMTAIRSHFTPEHVEIEQGDHVTWHITNIERAYDATHGFAIPGYDINLSLEANEHITFEFDATAPGVFSYYCTEFCSALHLEMKGYLLVKPAE